MKSKPSAHVAAKVMFSIVPPQVKSQGKEKGKIVTLPPLYPVDSPNQKSSNKSEK